MYLQNLQQDEIFVPSEMKSLKSLTQMESRRGLENAIISNGKIVNAAGKLAGSSITQIDAVKNAVNVCNIPLDEALSMASRYPAEYLGIDDHLGTLKAGHRVDIVHFDSNFNVLNVWGSGKQVKNEEK